MPHPLTVALLGWLLWIAPAWADDDPFAWTQPPPEDQLADDTTEIPVGKGAVFVPALTSPTAEPPVILIGVDGSPRDIPTGQRVLVDPGTYTIIVSPGTPTQGVGTSFTVREAETTLVPVTWGALRVLVTDERRIPFRGQYDLIRAENREPVGTGFGADTFQGEQLLTWLLPPGVYRIGKPGANYRQLRNFATVYVPPAGLVRYRIVADPTTGDFLGAGVLLPDEFGADNPADRRWFHGLVIGADGSLVHSNNVVGVNNQLVVSGNLFVDHQLGYTRNGHTFRGLFQLEAGATRIQPQNANPLPLVKTRDRIQGDLLYTWFVRESFGPYARVGAETRAFNTQVLAVDDTTYHMRRADGTVDVHVLTANDTLRVADAWQPSIFRQGAGMNLRAVNNSWVTFNLRAGLGARQNLFQGAFVLEDDRRTREIEYTEVETFYQEGLEATAVLTARLPLWTVYSTDLEVFADFQNMDRPSLEWRNSVSMRLTRFLSLNYFANVDYLPQVVNTVQLEHSVVLRAAWTIL